MCLTKRYFSHERIYVTYPTGRKSVNRRTKAKRAKKARNYTHKGPPHSEEQSPASAFAVQGELDNRLPSPSSHTKKKKQVAPSVSSLSTFIYLYLSSHVPTNHAVDSFPGGGHTHTGHPNDTKQDRSLTILKIVPALRDAPPSR